MLFPVKIKEDSLDAFIIFKAYRLKGLEEKNYLGYKSAKDRPTGLSIQGSTHVVITVIEKVGTP